MTGRHPVTVGVRENPTRRWLGLAETELLVNGTSPARGPASLDRFHWLDDGEREALQAECGMVSLELLAEIHLERPGYLQVLAAAGPGAKAAAAAARGDGRSDGALSRAMSLLKSKNGEKISDSAAALLDDEFSLDDSNDRLWVTGFSLAGRQGLVTAVDCQSCQIRSVNDRSRKSMLWPNEAQVVPADLLGSYVEGKQRRQVHHQESPDTSTTTKQETQEQQQQYQDALLVCDGFLVPTKDRGGLYVIRNPGHESEWTVCLTNERDRWFYHRAVWLDLTGDGRQSILTARCKVSTVLGNRQSADGMVTSGITKSGELVWLECPKPASIDPETGTPLESDGTVFDPFSRRHLPWKTRVLATGPDVMFAVADLDAEDDTVEVIASEFFQERVSLHSIQRGPKPKVVFRRTIDENCGRAFCSILADLDGTNSDKRDEQLHHSSVVLDSGSTVDSLTTGDSFSHLLVTSHECSYATDSNGNEVKSPNETSGQRTNGETLDKPYVPDSASPTPEGGSLFAYEVPEGVGAWKTENWKRTIVASGFKVKGQLSNMINPGAPGFVYTFHAKKTDSQQGKRPMIAVAGDCAESAYIFRPETITERPNYDSTRYKLMVEVQCEATVGSIGIGYNDFSSTEQESGYAKLYVPCYEKDKILVFGLGSGEDDNGGW